MKRLKTLKLTALFLASLTLLQGQDLEVKGENVRVIHYRDGSQAQFERMDNNKTMVKKTFAAKGGYPTMVTIYRMDESGNPLSCIIYDGGQKQELFRVRYGYRKTDGQLVEEQMFDSRTRRIDKNSGKEIPVQRVIYFYNAEGQRSAPITINLLPGKTFREIYGSDSSAIEVNPFDADAKEKLANPKAKPVGH
ncbi:hypothetical protein JIN85_13765 [Luteolibacter pohnpeiensis]|uniref:DUF4412 domain-containing protein n=1 Tax=Luteolibacter pohnpeiensis TaxID=454153 RepID=A0A934VXG4_9BACT|nr:hypothetical protein [Luteolibacter pohnpeiensis]MBK1883489.1 hypothetical protein [Luteolibacter pohnpeiensis]